MDTPIRIFVSYSTEDRQLVESLIRLLEQEGMSVLWSKKLSVGEAFDEEIKRFIAHAHVFMPVLTESALSRGWVQQEIGYALGLHVPVFPVTKDTILPGGMLQKQHAVCLSDDPEVLKSQLSKATFESLVKRSNLPAIYTKALRSESRAEMICEYANVVSNLGEYGLIRQKGGLSSFHIPKQSIKHKIWDERYFPEKRTDFHKEQQHNERLALQSHADQKAVRLIINPQYGVAGRDPISANARLVTLIDFLEQHPNEVVISIDETPNISESITILGDWFLAESVSLKEGDGFTNTFFTRNTAEIHKRIVEFESEMQYNLEQCGFGEKESREQVIKILRSKLVNH